MRYGIICKAHLLQHPFRKANQGGDHDRDEIFVSAHYCVLGDDVTDDFGDTGCGAAGEYRQAGYRWRGDQ
jgi:hypothetical protein